MDERFVAFVAGQCTDGRWIDRWICGHKKVGEWIAGQTESLLTTEEMTAELI